MKPSFTVTLIARNEEKTLPRLVASLREFQDRGGEILLLDTGSTDQTREVAIELGCRVVPVGDMFLTVVDDDLAKKVNDHFIINGEEPILRDGDRLFDFASARNYIAAMAATDWIWMPDCDEIFTKFDIDAINSAISPSDQFPDERNRLEYEFIFSHDADGKPAIRFMHSKMYRKSQLEWKGIVHEVLSTIEGTVQGSARYVTDDKVLLEHYQNVDTNRAGYLRGLALDCYLHPGSDRNSHYLAREMLWTGRPCSAIREFERHIAMNRWPTEASQSMIYIGDAVRMLGKDPVEWYQKAYNLESGRREPLMRLGEYYFELGDYRKVVAYMEMALTIPRSNFYADFQEHYTYKPHELLYVSYWQLGDRDKSRYHYDQAASYRPNDFKILNDRQFYYPLPRVTVIIPSLGRPEGLRKCLDSIKGLIYPKELIEVLTIEGDEKTVPQKVAEGLSHAIGDVIVYGANDIEFAPGSMMIAMREIADGNDLVAFNTGDEYPDRGNVCEHFAIRREFVDRIGGEIFDTRLYHTCCDNLLWARANRFGTATRSRDAVVRHYHFSKGYDMDAVYEKGWDHGHMEKDRALLKELMEKEGLN